MKEKMNCIKNTMLLGVIFFLLNSCSNKLTIEMPKGPAGASAYEVWVQAVKDGTIVWDADRTDLNNYFLYLKGEDGKDGSNGKDAYQLWLDEVASGIDDPHNPGQQWSKNQTSMQDFWYFLTGAAGQNGSPPTIGANGNWFIDGVDTGISAQGKDGRDGSVVTIGANGNWFIDGIDTGETAFGTAGTPGQSAYDLWVQEVQTGTVEDPHNPGQLWSPDKTTTQDFWDFLRGNDGNQGETNQEGGETGQPGEDIKIILGKPNVIPLYVNQNYNEFVRWEDGSVGYIVYNDAGNLAAGAIVKGLPGIKDPTKEYIADADGFFLVPKEDLPENTDISKRRGATASVTYTNSQGQTVDEASAPNTYVPNRMYVRVRLQTDPLIDGTYMRFSPLVERETDGKGWEMIPSYLGNLTQSIVAYSLSDPNNPSSYDGTSATFTAADTNIDISSHTIMLRINRLRKSASYYHPVDEWDEQDHYFTLVLESYYGENPSISAVIKMAPIQAMPMLKDNVKAFTYDPAIGDFNRIEGELDVANIDQSLLFNNVLSKESKTTGVVSYDYYYPVVDDYSTAINTKQFTVRFNVTGHNQNATSSISSPAFSITTVYIGASVILECSGSYFYSLNTIGYLRFGTDGDFSTLKIVKRTANPDGWRYVFNDMPVSYTP